MEKHMSVGLAISKDAWAQDCVLAGPITSLCGYCWHNATRVPRRLCLVGDLLGKGRFWSDQQAVKQLAVARNIWLLKGIA